MTLRRSDSAPSLPARWGRRALAVVAATVALVGLGAGPASAHVVPTTTVMLDVGADSITANLRIPLSDVQLATGIAVDAHPAAQVRASAAQLRTYLAAHIRPSSGGAAWAVRVGALRVSDAEQTGTGAFDVLDARVLLTPPSTEDLRRFTLRYDVILDRVPTHTALVAVRTDWASGRIGSVHQIGTVQVHPVDGSVPALQVELGPGSDGRGFMAMVALGAQHIREGTDHLLFLLALLIPAPLLVRAGRYAGPATPRRAVRRITAITLAFTLGHSVALAVSALDHLQVPQAAVETAIAVSILVAAVHALRPIFPGREAVVAGAFGLVHGMAFSVTLSELGLSGGQLALSLLGFNIGIELMQLAVVALTLPALILLARTPAETAVRIIAAGLTAVLAVGWLLARAGAANPIAAAADGLTDAAPWIVGAIWLTTLIAVIAMRAQGGDRPPAAREVLEPVEQ